MTLKQFDGDRMGAASQNARLTGTVNLKVVPMKTDALCHGVSWRRDFHGSKLPRHHFHSISSCFWLLESWYCHLVSEPEYESDESGFDIQAKLST